MQRAGVNVAALTTSLNTALGKLAKVSGNAGEVQLSRESSALFNLAEKGLRGVCLGDMYVYIFIYQGRQVVG